MACALCATFAGGIFLWASQFFKTDKAPFFASFGFSLFWASAIWIAPIAFPMGHQLASAVIAVLMGAAYPAIKYAFRQVWSISAFVWSAFMFSQIAVFFAAYYYLK